MEKTDFHPLQMSVLIIQPPPRTLATRCSYRASRHAKQVENALNPMSQHSQCSQPHAHKQNPCIDMSDGRYWQNLEPISSSESGLYEILASKPSLAAVRTTHASLLLLSCATMGSRSTLQRYSDLARSANTNDMSKRYVQSYPSRTYLLISTLPNSNHLAQGSLAIASRVR
jgi:hypothetical protein